MLVVACKRGLEACSVAGVGSYFGFSALAPRVAPPLFGDGPAMADFASSAHFLWR